FSSTPPKQRPPKEDKPREPEGIQYPELLAAVRAQYGSVKSVAGALMNVVRSSRAKDHELVSPLEAPRCILNARISKSRRFATAKLATARMKAVAKAVGGTINDVILALSATSLRRYMIEQNALPSAPLVAMLPVHRGPRAADVQRGHLERPRPRRAALLPRRAARGRVSDVDPGARAGAQHHLQQLRGQRVLRLHGLPRHGPAPPAHRGVLRRGD